MSENALREKLAARIEGRLDRLISSGSATTYAAGVRDLIMDDVDLYCEVQAVKRERAAYERGVRVFAPECGADKALAMRNYPMPSRTREALREEPVPGTDNPLYRFSNGMIEVAVRNPNGSQAPWERCCTCEVGSQKLMHWADLHDNPTRKETVPVDENDPWGEGEG
jgi:hypothetical protein